MSKDLEDFLRQAAQTRQRKQAERLAEAEQQRNQEARLRPSPYTNASQERLVEGATDYFDDAEVEILDERDVEIIDAVHVVDDQDNHRNTPPSNDSSPRAMTAARISSPEHDSPRQSEPRPADALKEIIRTPGGLRQAFLIREILNRPQY